MSSDNITTMRPKDGPPSSKPEDPDHDLLDFIANWHVARCRAQLHWAEGNAQSLYGTQGKGKGAPHDDLDDMAKYESLVTMFTPKTVRGARLKMEVALTILRHRENEPDAALAKGPVVEIFNDVLERLRALDGDILLPEEKW